MRAHIIVPDELIAAVDALVGTRRRSRFIAEAIEEKLRQDRLLDAFDDFAGSLAGVDVPGWETSEAAADWVRSMRREEPNPWDSGEHASPDGTTDAA